MTLSKQSASKATLIEYGRWLQARGYQVGENPAFGGVAPVHVPGSWHYLGLAIDVNWPVASQERAKILGEALPEALRRGLACEYSRDGHVRNHDNHLHVDCGSYNRLGPQGLTHIGAASATGSADIKGSTVGDLATAVGIGTAAGILGPNGTSVVAGVGGATLGAAGSVLTGIDAVGGFFGALSQRGTWVRVLQVVGGAALVTGGVAIVGHGVIGKAATELLPVGKAAKALSAAA